MTNPVDYWRAQVVFPMGRALHCQWNSGSRNLPLTKARQHRCGQPVEYRASTPLLSVEAYKMQSYVPIYSFNKVCRILYITFYLLSFFTESLPTRSGAVSRPPSQPPLGVQPVGQEQPAPILMNIAEYVLELLCVTLIHYAY